MRAPTGHLQLLLHLVFGFQPLAGATRPVGRARPCGDSPFGTARVASMHNGAVGGLGRSTGASGKVHVVKDLGAGGPGLVARILVAELEDVEGVEDDRLGRRPGHNPWMRAASRSKSAGLGGCRDLAVEDDIAEQIGTGQLGEPFGPLASGGRRHGRAREGQNWARQRHPSCAQLLPAAEPRLRWAA